MATKKPKGDIFGKSQQFIKKTKTKTSLQHNYENT